MKTLLALITLLATASLSYAGEACHADGHKDGHEKPAHTEAGASH